MNPDWKLSVLSRDLTRPSIRDDLVYGHSERIATEVTQVSFTWLCIAKNGLCPWILFSVLSMAFLPLSRFWDYLRTIRNTSYHSVSERVYRILLLLLFIIGWLSRYFSSSYSILDGGLVHAVSMQIDCEKSTYNMVNRKYN